MDPCKCSSDVAICNALLGFIGASMQCSTMHNIRRVVLGSFTPDAIHDAKTALWERVSSDLIGEMKLRRGSQAKSKEEFEVDDILEAMSALDRNDKTPPIHIPAMQLFQLPRMKQEEMLPVQMIERFNDLEQRVNGLTDSLTAVKSDNIALSRRVHSLEEQEFPALSSRNVLPSAGSSHGTSNPQSAGPSGASALGDQEGSSTTLQNVNQASYSSALKTKQGPMPAPAQKSKPVSRQMVRLATSKLTVVTGKRANTDVVKGSLPAKHLYVYHVSPCVSMDDLKKHIVQAGVDVRGIRRISKEDWLHGAYKVDINAKDMTKVMNEEFWPESVCCREWMPFIPRKMNTNNNNGDTAK